MKLDFLKEKRSERVTEWITGGSYAVAVAVEAIIYPERPDAPYLSPDTVRYLEKLARLARAGDVEELKKAGTVYVLLSEPAALASSGIDNRGTQSSKVVTP